jgi:hypothetical protein
VVLVTKKRLVVSLCALSFCVLALPPGNSAADLESGWGSPVLIENYQEGGSYLPSIAVDGDGNAFAVWNQNYGAGYSVMANILVADEGWKNAEMIDLGWGSTSVPKVVTGGDGNAFAIWQQSDGVRTNIWACRYVQSFGWELPELVETNDAFPAIDPAIAVDGDGNALAVWVQSDGSFQTMYSAGYTDGVGWEAIGLVAPGLMEEDANLPDLAGDGNGDFMAVWIQDDGIRNNVRANRYNVDTGWGTAVLVETNDDGTSMGPSVAMDASGNAVAVWDQYDGLRYNIYANHYETGSGWGTAELLEDIDDGYAESPSVVMDSEGNAIAVWRQWEGARANALANRYVEGVGWGEPEHLESYDDGNIRDVRVSVNSDGAAFAIWNQYGMGYDDVWSNRYIPGTGWGDPAPVETSPGLCTDAAIGVDEGGNAVAIWGQVDYDFESMFANRFVVADTEPPSLAVSTPVTGETVTTSAVTVAGVTEPGAMLYIDGLLALVDEDSGEFEAVITLLEGGNSIVLTAVDSADNSETVTITVTYDAPEVNLTALLEEIALLQEENEDMLDQLNMTQGTLDEMEDRLHAAEDDLEQAQSDIEGVPTSTFVLGAVAVVAIVLLIVILAMYIGLRKQMRGPGGPQEEPGLPDAE